MDPQENNLPPVKNNLSSNPNQLMLFILLILVGISTSKKNQKDITPVTVSFSASLDLNQFLDQLARVTGYILSLRQNIVVSSPHAGTKWISYKDSEIVLSAYYHPTKVHTATASNGKDYRSEAAPGEWAVAICSNKFFEHSRTYYNEL